MSDFVIEKGIPLPAPDYRQKNGKRGGRPPAYPWYELEIGDSVLRPSDDEAEAGVEWARRHARVFTRRKQDDGSGWRVWRKA